MTKLLNLNNLENLNDKDMAELIEELTELNNHPKIKEFIINKNRKNIGEIYKAKKEKMAIILSEYQTTPFTYSDILSGNYRPKDYILTLNNRIVNVCKLSLSDDGFNYLISIIKKSLPQVHESGYIPYNNEEYKNSISPVIENKWWRAFLMAAEISHREHFYGHSNALQVNRNITNIKEAVYNVGVEKILVTVEFSHIRRQRTLSPDKIKISIKS